MLLDRDYSTTMLEADWRSKHALHKCSGWMLHPEGAHTTSLSSHFGEINLGAAAVREHLEDFSCRSVPIGVKLAGKDQQHFAVDERQCVSWLQTHAAPFTCTSSVRGRGGKRNLV